MHKINLSSNATAAIMLIFGFGHEHKLPADDLGRQLPKIVARIHWSDLPFEVEFTDFQYATVCSQLESTRMQFIEEYMAGNPNIKQGMDELAQKFSYEVLGPRNFTD